MSAVKVNVNYTDVCVCQVWMQIALPTLRLGHDNLRDTVCGKGPRLPVSPGFGHSSATFY